MLVFFRYRMEQLIGISKLILVCIDILTKTTQLNEVAMTLQVRFSLQILGISHHQKNYYAQDWYEIEKTIWKKSLKNKENWQVIEENLENLKK